MDSQSTTPIRGGLPHRAPANFADRLAWRLVVFLRYFVDVFFRGRYGHHAVILETVAAVPGMVAGALIHLRCLRRFEDGIFSIQEVTDEPIDLGFWSHVAHD